VKTTVCLSVLLCACAAAIVRAGDCCQRCGCHSACHKVCRVVCEIKKVPKTEYDCECEEFCVPGKSERCLTYDECGKRQCVYTPVCGQVRTRTKLVKKQVIEEKPSYKWVVEDLCCNCAASCEQGTAPRETHHEQPAPPRALEPHETGAERIFGTASRMPPNAVDVPQPPSYDVSTAVAEVVAPVARAGGPSPLERALRPLFGGR
jgi:hypothetical protein